MLTREQRIEIKGYFSREAELEKNIAWNISEVLTLKASKPKNSITEKAFQMADAIRYGENIISKQERELRTLSIPAISAKMGISKESVRYYKGIFREGKSMLRTPPKPEGPRSGMTGLGYEQQQKVLKACERSKENQEYNL